MVAIRGSALHPLLAAVAIIITCIHGASASSQQGTSSTPPLLSPQTCSDSLQLFHKGAATSQINLEVRLAESGDLSNSISNILMDLDWSPTLSNIALRAFVNGYPNFVLNATDFDKSIVYLNFFLEEEWPQVIKGPAGGCVSPPLQDIQPWNYLNINHSMAQSIFTVRSNYVCITTCQMFYVYWVVKIIAAEVAGKGGRQQVLWVGADWVEAKDPRNSVCPNSPTSWSYTKLGVLYCPCGTSMQPPPPPAPTAAPLPQPECSDTTLRLSRHGVYTDTIDMPVRNSWTNEIMSPSVLTMDVTWKLHMEAGVRGYPVWALNWTQGYGGNIDLLTLNETMFNKLFLGPSVDCFPPGPLYPPDVFVLPNMTYGLGPLNFVLGDLSAMMKPCQPLTLYLLASISDLTGNQPNAWAAADWIPPHDPFSPVCPNANTSWGYTKFEVTHCPCTVSPEPPQSAHHPLPPAPPTAPLPSNDVLVQGFPFSACKARNITVSPYRLTPPAGPYNVTSTDATYCFSIIEFSGAEVSGSGSCSRMVLNKIELIIHHDCVEESPKALRAITVNGVPVSPVYSIKTWNGQSYGLLAISGLTEVFPVTPPGGLYTCLKLRRGRACGTPAGLCFGSSCVYSLFDAERYCCPAGQVPF